MHQMAKCRSTKQSAIGGVFHELRQCDKQDSDAFAWHARGALDDINNLKGNLGNTPSFSLESCLFVNHPNGTLSSGTWSSAIYHRLRILPKCDRGTTVQIQLSPQCFSFPF